MAILWPAWRRPGRGDAPVFLPHPLIPSPEGEGVENGEQLKIKTRLNCRVFIKIFFRFYFFITAAIVLPISAGLATT